MQICPPNTNLRFSTVDCPVRFRAGQVLPDLPQQGFPIVGEPFLHNGLPKSAEGVADLPAIQSQRLQVIAVHRQLPQGQALALGADLLQQDLHPVKIAVVAFVRTLAAHV